MRLVEIGKNEDSSSKTMEKIELPDDPQNNLVFDPRPIGDGDRFGFKVDDGNVTFTRTDTAKNYGWGYYRCFRLYFRNEEDVPPFDNSVPYLYEGQFGEHAPQDAIEVKVKKDVTIIKERAFYFCKKLVSVDMSDSQVRKIEDKAFKDCESLKHVRFPRNVTLKMIGEEAFWNCKSIEVLLIPPSVESIGEYAFGYCSNLKVIKLPDDIDLDEIGDDMVDGCFALAPTFPADITEYKEGLQWLKERYDAYPLHKICYNANVTIAEINQCIEENPNSTYDTDDLGMTALHLISAEIAHFTTQKDIIRILALCQDEKGNYAATIVHPETKYTAIDMALKYYKASVDICALLYSFNPIPRSTVKDNNEKERLTDAVETYIDEFQKKVTNGLERIHRAEKLGFVSHITTCLNYNEDKVFITKWEDFFSDASKCPLDKLKIITEWKGIGGRKVMYDALPSIRDVIKSRIAFLGRYEIIKGPVIHKSDTAIVVQARDLKSDEFYGDKFDGFFSDDENRKKRLNLADFKTLIQSITGGSVEGDGWDAEFERFDQSGDHYIQRGEFIVFCRDFFDGGHQSRSVALKFMTKIDQYNKEVNSRKDLKKVKDLDSIVVSVEDHRNGISEEEFDKVREAISVTREELECYRMVLIMPYGDRNLDSVYRVEQPDINKTRSIVNAVAKAADKIHREGKISHSDLAPRNTMRFEDHIKLIDLDAAAKIPSNPDHESDLDASYYVGSKFSSGIIPPEMIEKLDEDGCNKYIWYFASIILEPDALAKLLDKDDDVYGDISKQIGQKDPIDWEKIRPKVDRNGSAYVVKTFKTSMGEPKTSCGTEFPPVMEIVKRDLLPYDPVLASEAIDLWSLGVLLYTLITGKPLFDVDRNDDLRSVEAFKELHSWSDDHKLKKLQDIKDATAKDLLSKLLSRDPNDRGSMSKVLDHVFFKTEKEELYKDQIEKIKANQLIQTNYLKKIDESTVYINRSIKDSSQKLMKAIFEATEVTVPTCFIICPLEEETDIITQIESQGLKMKELFSKFTDCAKCLTDPSKDNLKAAAGHFINDDKETYGLYLIDEYTGDPVGDPYEIELTEKKLYHNFIPVMLSGLSALSMANRVGKLAKAVTSFIFPPAAAMIPTIEDGKLESLQEGIEALANDDHEYLKEAAESGKRQTVRGAKLRKFEEFLRELEAKQLLNFCGLKRVCDSNGNATWVSEDSYEAMKSDTGLVDAEKDELRKEIAELKEKMNSGTEANTKSSGLGSDSKLTSRTGEYNSGGIQEIREMKSQMTGLESKMESQMTGLESEMKSQMTGLESEMKSQMTSLENLIKEQKHGCCIVQ